MCSYILKRKLLVAMFIAVGDNKFNYISDLYTFIHQQQKNLPRLEKVVDLVLLICTLTQDFTNTIRA